jgi:Ca2+-binding EF-hand superfamily protein
MIAADIGLVFDTLDRNNDGKLSVNEFKTYIKGVERSREKRIAEMDPTVTK